MKKTLIVGMLIYISLIFAGCGAKTYNLNDYITYEINGINGYGKLFWGFDHDGLAEDIIAGDMKNYSTEEEQISLLWDVSNYEFGEWNKIENLGNGETIHFNWFEEDISDFNESHKKIKVKGEPIEYKIEKLEEIGRIDVFEGIEINVEGISPQGELSIKRGKYSDIYFTADKNSGLKNGDEITITANAPLALESYCINNYQAMPETDELKYTVEGLDSYISELSQLDEESIKLIKETVLLDRKENLANEYSNILEEKYEDLGFILLTKKEQGNMFADENILYNIIKVDAVCNQFGSDEKVRFTNYLYYEFSDVIKYNDGTTYVDITNYNSTSKYTSSITAGNRSFGGYETYDALYNDVVTGNLTKYAYDISKNENPEVIDVGTYEK